jgi:hypothetical protein
MSEDVLGRVKGDLAVIQRAMGLRLSFGKGMLVTGTALSVAAFAAAVISLLVDNDVLQVALLAGLVALPLVGLFLRSRGATDLPHEVTIQVALSVSIYAFVWIAACGYTLAAFVGPFVGVARTALLHATSIGILIAFTLLLVRAALKSREQHYCLGLALSTLLAGMLLPVLDKHFSFPLAHCFMAIGFLTSVAIQWAQLREAASHHAAN